MLRYTPPELSSQEFASHTWLCLDHPLLGDWVQLNCLNRVLRPAADDEQCVTSVQRLGKDLGLTGADLWVPMTAVSNIIASRLEHIQLQRPVEGLLGALNCPTGSNPTTMNDSGVNTHLYERLSATSLRTCCKNTSAVEVVHDPLVLDAIRAHTQLLPGDTAATVPSVSLSPSQQPPPPPPPTGPRRSLRVDVMQKLRGSRGAWSTLPVEDRKRQIRVTKMKGKHVRLQLECDVPLLWHTIVVTLYERQTPLQTATGSRRCGSSGPWIVSPASSYVVQHTWCFDDDMEPAEIDTPTRKCHIGVKLFRLNRTLRFDCQVTSSADFKLVVGSSSPFVTHNSGKSLKPTKGQLRQLQQLQEQQRLSAPNDFSDSDSEPSLGLLSGLVGALPANAALALNTATVRPTGAADRLRRPNSKRNGDDEWQPRKRARVDSKH